MQLTSDSGRTGVVAEDQAERQPEDKLFVAPPWQLAWWRFTQHKVAVVAGAVIIAFYVIAIFAEFFAPYLPNTRDIRNAYMPPQRVHVGVVEGVGFRPFVYGITTKIHPTTLRSTFSEDTNRRYPVGFFVRRESYKLLGLISSDIHLFGVAPGGGLYLMGTDRVGRCVVSQIIYGSRISLSMGLLGVLLSLILGVVIGGVSGYLGGVVDDIVQRVIEVIRSFPSLALWMALSAALPRHWSQLQVYFAIVVILSLIGWTTLARQVRGKMLSLREEDFVLAARLNGTGVFRLLRVHLVPSFLSHIIATLTLAVPAMILSETALSFLGLGLARPAVSWGVLLRDAQTLEALTAAPWLFWPAAILVLTVLAFNFLGDGLRDAADPYSKLS